MPKNRIHTISDGRYAYKVADATGKEHALRSRKGETLRDFRRRCDALDKKALGRILTGLTQKEAGALIGVSELTIRNWELENYKPTPERLPSIEEAYKIPIANIII